MADQESTPQAADTAAPAENTAAESATEEKTTPDAAPEASAKDDKSKPETTETPQPTGDQKPPSRRSAQFRIQELAKENRELRIKNEQLRKNTADDDQDGEDQPDSKPQESKPNVRAEVERYVAPVLKQSQQTADDAELQELFAGDNAALRDSMEPVIRKMWKQNQYKDMAASDLLKIAHYDAAIAEAGKKAVEAYKAAEKQAKEESTGGSSSSTNRTSSKPASQMTDQELLEHNERVKAGKAA